MEHLVHNAPLLVITTNGAPSRQCAITANFVLFFFCKTTNGAPPAGAPLVTRVTNGALAGGAPLVTWDPNKIFWTAPHLPTHFPHFIPSTSFSKLSAISSSSPHFHHRFIKIKW